MKQMIVSALTDNNKDLERTSGDEIGDIERVVESVADKKQYVVVINGAFLGLFDTERAIPLGNVTAQGDHILLHNMSDDQLKSLPMAVACATSRSSSRPTFDPSSKLVRAPVTKPRSGPSPATSRMAPEFELRQIAAVERTSTPSTRPPSPLQTGRLGRAFPADPRLDADENDDRLYAQEHSGFAGPAESYSD
jgi:hypothetical protein